MVSEATKALHEAARKPKYIGEPNFHFDHMESDFGAAIDDFS